MWNSRILEGVMAAPISPPHEKYIMLCFARYADSKGHGIRPGLEAIAQETGKSVRTIKRILAAIVADGWLLPDGKERFNVYRVNMDKLEHYMPQRASGGNSGGSLHKSSSKVTELQRELADFEWRQSRGEPLTRGDMDTMRWLREKIALAQQHEKEGILQR